MNEKLSFPLPDEINPLQRAEAIRPAPINPTFILDFTWYSFKLWKNTVLWQYYWSTQGHVLEFTQIRDKARIIGYLYIYINAVWATVYSSRNTSFSLV